MLNKVISCVNYFKYDWHAKYGMIIYELYIPFLKVCDSGKFPELVWLVVNCR